MRWYPFLLLWLIPLRTLSCNERFDDIYARNRGYILVCVGPTTFVHRKTSTEWNFYMCIVTKALLFVHLRFCYAFLGLVIIYAFVLPLHTYTTWHVENWKPTKELWFNGSKGHPTWRPIFIPFPKIRSPAASAVDSWIRTLPERYVFLQRVIELFIPPFLHIDRSTRFFAHERQRRESSKVVLQSAKVVALIP